MDRLRLLGILHQEWGIRAYQKRATAEILAEYDRLTALNAQLLEALKEIAKGEGAFCRDPFEHACNCIDNMKAIAQAAIRAAEEGGEA
jgi:hypothetical protein